MKRTRKSIFGRVAASLVAAALLASMTAVPAFAASDDPGITYPPFQENKFTIQKTLYVQENSYTPTVTFDFTVTPGTADSKAEAGPTDGVKQVSGAAFTTGDTTGGNSTADATFQVDMSKFKHAGVYKYTVTETTPDNPYAGITYTKETKTLYVYIENDGSGLKLAYTELVDENGTGKTNNFDNTYGDTDTDKNILNDLTLKKTISGTGANMSEKFTFTIKVDGDEKGEKFLVKFSDGTTADLTLISGESKTITLGNNDTATIYGLSAGDTYTITENEGGQNGYTTTVSGDTFEEGTYKVTGTISNDTTIAYDNNKGASTPTGVIMNIAPYALLVVVALGACCIFFVRKRREA